MSRTTKPGIVVFVASPSERTHSEEIPSENASEGPSDMFSSDVPVGSATNASWR